jgi:hypothetical protein
MEWTFNTEAEKHEKMRPGYVSELYEDIFKYISMDESSNVVEIGIGGGQATLPILKTGCKLTASAFHWIPEDIGYKLLIKFNGISPVYHHICKNLNIL